MKTRTNTKKIAATETADNIATVPELTALPDHSPSLIASHLAWAKASRFARMPDAELLDHLDELVRNATWGDRRAIGAIALAFTRDLLAAANAMLDNEHDAADVVQDFFLALVEEKVERFVPGQARARPFMLGVVKAMAMKKRAEEALR
jgi:hypothetical protein